MKNHDGTHDPMPQPPTTVFEPTHPLPSNTLVINLRPYGRDRRPGARIP